MSLPSGAALGRQRAPRSQPAARQAPLAWAPASAPGPQVEECKRRINTFAFVGDLEGACACRCHAALPLGRRPAAVR